MTGKSIKIPDELKKYIELHNDGRPPGEILCDMVKDYQKLREGIGAALAAQGKISNGQYNISEIIMQYLVDERQQITVFQKDLSELKMIVIGLKMLFEKTK